MACINMGDEELSPGLAHVAFSRVTRFEELVIHPFPTWEKFEQINSARGVRERVEELQ
jgi:hypothetical protein